MPLGWTVNRRRQRESRRVDIGGTWKVVRRVATARTIVVAAAGRARVTHSSQQPRPIEPPVTARGTSGEDGHTGEKPGRLTQKRGLRMIADEFTPGQLRAMYGPVAAEDVAMVEANMQD